MVAVEWFLFIVGSLTHFQIFKGCKSFFAMDAVKDLYLVLDLPCTFKPSSDAKAPLQSWQLKGFSWVLVHLCTFKSSLDAIAALQWMQLK